ncbi:hypothetical protein RAS1_04730 [Phycisphaerae bacterium RAS1]|nr:hypothetical protein RAS1_04730 [Phycisphaerae bacterium RAS1]
MAPMNTLVVGSPGHAHANACTPAASPSPRTAGYLLALLVTTAALDFIYYTGYYASDDIEYLTAAHQIYHQASLPAEPTLGQIRMTPVLYNVAVAALAGFRTPVIAGSYVLFHLLLVLQTWHLARRWHGDPTAWLAASGVAILPMLALTSTMILPDNPMACCLLAGLALCDGAARSHAAGRSAAAVARMALSGVCVGIGYAAKESALVVLPLFGAAWLWASRRDVWRRGATGVIALGIGVAVVFIVEWALLSTFIGRSYTRMAWTVGEDSFSSGLQSFPSGVHPWERLKNVWANVTAPWFSKVDKVLLVAGPLAYALLRGRLLPLLFAAWFFAYHTWGSTKLTQYLPTTLQVRYYTPILPLIAIMVAFALVRAHRFITTGAPLTVRRAVAAVAVVGGLAYFALEQRRVAYGAEWLYRGDIVRPAIRAAETNWARPVVFSGTLTRHLRALYLDTSPPAEFGDDLDPARVDEWLDRGGFVYLELFPEARLRAVLRRAPLDALLHPVLFPRAASQAAATQSAATAGAPPADQPQALTLYGRSVLVERVAHFYCPKSRWHSLLRAAGCGAAEKVDKNKRSTVAYRVYPAP